MMKILAIDCGTISGFAVDGPDPLIPLIWSVRFPSGDGADLGRSYGRFGQTIREAIEVHKPDVVVFEAPLPASVQVRKENSNASVRMQFGRAGIVEEVVYNAHLPCREGDVQTVRHAVMGTGRPEDPKTAVMRHCDLLGWRAPDHNGADAALLWAYAKQKWDRSFGARANPLFMNGRRSA